MWFKEMDPEMVRQLISDEPDVITQAAKVEQDLFDHLQCPVCGGEGTDKIVKPPKFSGEGGLVVACFTPEKPLPTGTARCRTCNSEFDPYTRVIIKVGEPIITAAQVEDLPQM